MGVKVGNDVTVTSRKKRVGGGVGERGNGGGGGGRRLVCQSDGLANHACGLKHGIIDAIECFNVVAVSRVMH